MGKPAANALIGNSRGLRAKQGYELNLIAFSRNGSPSHLPYKLITIATQPTVCLAAECPPVGLPNLANLLVLKTASGSQESPRLADFLLRASRAGH